jgi:hypothetical protein
MHKLKHEKQEKEMEQRKRRIKCEKKVKGKAAAEN